MVACVCARVCVFAAGILALFNRVSTIVKTVNEKEQVIILRNACRDVGLFCSAHSPGPDILPALGCLLFSQR